MNMMKFAKSDTRDIRLLKTRINEHIKNEDYERAAVLKEWIKEIKERTKLKKKGLYV